MIVIIISNNSLIVIILNNNSFKFPFQSTALYYSTSTVYTPHPILAYNSSIHIGCYSNKYRKSQFKKKKKKISNFFLNNYF